MDSKKLEDLRARYAAATAGQSHDPEFRKIIEQVFAGTDRRPKPYEGVSTLLGAPLRVDADLGGLDAALVGVPMDLGVTNRAGARLGPRAVRPHHGRELAATRRNDLAGELLAELLHDRQRRENLRELVVVGHPGG